jgi:hypothetical protein
MIALVDLKEERFECTDLPDLAALVKQLLGRPFQFFRISYGDELRLHLGDLRAYSNPKLQGMVRGTYIVSARTSSWVVSSVPRSVLLLSDDLLRNDPDLKARGKRVDIKSIEETGFILPGSVVEHADAARSPFGFMLRLGFSDSSTVQIAPVPASGELPEENAVEDLQEKGGDVEISDWELLTPHQRILRVGPGPRWCYVNSARA